MSCKVDGTPNYRTPQTRARTVASGSNLTAVQLARLTKRQAREMIAALVEGAAPSAPGAGGGGGDGAPPSMSDTLIDALVARADGVPLFVEELTKSVVEAGNGA